jgi:hypothetical protein
MWEKLSISLLVMQYRKLLAEFEMLRQILKSIRKSYNKLIMVNAQTQQCQRVHLIFYDKYLILVNTSLFKINPQYNILCH